MVERSTIRLVGTFQMFVKSLVAFLKLQSSVLGPLLFLLFINDIVCMFGDDVTVKLFAFADVRETLRRSAERNKKYYEANGSCTLIGSNVIVLKGLQTKRALRTGGPKTNYHPVEWCEPKTFGRKHRKMVRLNPMTKRVFLLKWITNHVDVQN